MTKRIIMDKWIRGVVTVSRTVLRSMAIAAVAMLGSRILQAQTVDDETFQAGRFDTGKMWTFEYAPSEYFTETYGFEADEAWFESARMAALRIPGCSASFVSAHGLLATNHHCVRGRVAQISRGSEGLLDNGFYASNIEDERPIPGFYADQLIAIADISDEVFAAMDRATDQAGRDAARGRVLESVEARLLGQYRTGGDSIWVQIVPLYNGGRYSAYTFRRFTDVRLVFAVELQLGFFGGDPDNFTYPRYALDFAFLRVYQDGAPYETEHHFGWGDGVQEGDVVFVIGNPGPTNRNNTVAQLEFQHEVLLPASLNFLATRLEALARFWSMEPEEAEAMDVRNRMFGLSNSLKATTGRLAALNTPEVVGRRQDAENNLRRAIVENENLRTQFDPIFDEIAAIQEQKLAYAQPYGAFTSLTSNAYASATIRRAVAAAGYLSASGDSAGILRDSVLLRVRDFPQALEQLYLTARFRDFVRFFGPDHAVTRAALRGMSPEDAAADMLAATPLAGAETTRSAVETGRLNRDDPAVRLGAAIWPLYQEYWAEFNALSMRERELSAELGRARFEVYGSDLAPDATFSPRITDGVVMPYEYNGTIAPPFTTFYGLYDRYNAHRGAFDWALPQRWQTPPPGLDLGTPLNFVSTADTYGGNSGSPAVTPDLQLVGLNFDRNMEGLSRDYIYLPARGRNVMVDVRAVRAALDFVYDADRIVAEITMGRLFRTEAEADAARN